VKRSLVLSLAVALLLLVGSAEAQRSRKGRRANAAAPRPPAAAHMIVYDTGAPADALLTGSTAAEIGNRFNSNQGNPLPSAVISGVSFYLGRTHGGSVAGQRGPDTFVGYFSFYDAPAGTSAPIIAFFSVYPASVNPYNFNAFSFSPLTVGTDFLGGFYVASGAYIGVVNDTTAGQGNHGFYGNYSGGALVSFQAVSRNTMFRVSGSVIPVELMEFEIE